MLATWTSKCEYLIKSALFAVMSSEEGDPLTNNATSDCYQCTLKNAVFTNVSEVPEQPRLFVWFVNFTSANQNWNKQFPIFNNEAKPSLLHLPLEMPTSETRTCCTRYRHFIGKTIVRWLQNGRHTDRIFYTFQSKLTGQTQNIFILGLDQYRGFMRSCSKWKCRSS